MDQTAALVVVERRMAAARLQVALEAKAITAAETAGSQAVLTHQVVAAGLVP
jgi:hypothetical protein